MKRIIASARIFSDEGKPAGGHQVMVDAFSIQAQRFQVLSEGKTDKNGFVQMSFDGSKIEGTMAPALRLIEDGSPATRVLSSGGFMRHDRRSDTLFVDFGEIERLEETAFRRPAAGEGFSNQVHQVAGVINRPEGSQLALERNLSTQPELRASLATSSRPAGTFVVIDKSDGTVAGDDQITATATSDRVFTSTATVAVPTKEVDTLKAINVEKDEEIKRKDREIQDLKAKSSVKADVQSVVTGLGTKLSDANNDLKSKSLPFRIGTVKIDLRGKLSATGEEIELGGDDAIAGSGISTELHVDRGSGGPDQTKVPDVLGLTESAARRVLRSVGLRLKSARQTLAPGTGTPGQAITQHPKAGEDTTHGSEILVVFGVASTT